MLAEDPGRFGPYLQEAIEHIDDKKQPKVEVERCLSTLLHKNIAGWYQNNPTNFQQYIANLCTYPRERESILDVYSMISNKKVGCQIFRSMWQETILELSKGKMTAW